MSRLSKTLRERETPVPTEFKCVLEADFDQRFTWKERVQIALGYGLKIRAKFFCLHKPGKYHPTLKIETTKELPPTGEV